MNGNMKDYDLAKSHLARTQHHAEQHQLAEDLVAENKNNRAGLFGRLFAVLRRKMMKDTEQGPASVRQTPSDNKRMA